MFYRTYHGVLAVKDERATRSRPFGPSEIPDRARAPCSSARAGNPPVTIGSILS